MKHTLLPIITVIVGAILLAPAIRNVLPAAQAAQAKAPAPWQIDETKLIVWCPLVEIPNETEATRIEQILWSRYENGAVSFSIHTRDFTRHDLTAVECVALSKQIAAYQPEKTKAIQFQYRFCGTLRTGEIILNRARAIGPALGAAQSIEKFLIARYARRTR